MRDVSHRLHPSIIADLGLSAALEGLVDQERELGRDVRYAVRNVPDFISLDSATAVYRIAQEGLRNAAKHVPGAAVRVALACHRSELHLAIQDAGVGFSLAEARLRGGLGLISMQERAARRRHPAPQQPSWGGNSLVGAHEPTQPAGRRGRGQEHPRAVWRGDVPFGLLPNELVSNALKHAFPDQRSGIITIDIGHWKDDVVLRISDNGTGLPAGFDPEKSTSLGLKLVNLLMRQLRGHIQVKTGAGAVFKTRFPKRDDRKGEATSREDGEGRARQP